MLAKGNTFKHKRAIVEEIHKQKAEYILLYDLTNHPGHNAAKSFKIKWRLVVSRARLPARGDRTESSRREMLSDRMRRMLRLRRNKCVWNVYTRSLAARDTSHLFVICRRIHLNLNLVESFMAFLMNLKLGV